MSTVQIDIELVTKAFENALDNSRKKTEEFSSQASKSFSSVGSAFNVMAGNLAANAVGKALGFISDGFNRMIDEAADSEKNVNDLNIALGQAGIFSKTTSQSFQDLAQSISDVTTVDDDLILKTTSIIATLTTLNKQGLEEATKRAVDLSAALGIDLSTATEMVTKAINGNTTAFSKRGIVIEKGTNDQDRLNKLMEATAQFQDVAQQKTNTYTGAMEQQQNALGNLLAEFGFLVTKNENVISGIQGTTSVFQSLTKFLQANSGEINVFIESLKITIPILAAVGGAIGLATVGFTGLGVAATAAWTAVTAPVTLTIAAIAAVSYAVYQVYRNWELIKAGTLEATAAVLEYSAKAVSLLSSDKAQALRDQAQGYRDQAQAIREAKIAVEEKAAVDETAFQNEVLKQKQRAEMLQATEELRKELRLVQEEERIADDANELIRTDAKFKALTEQLGLEAAIHRQAQMNITTDKIENEKLRLQTQIDASKKKIKDTEEMNKKVQEAEKEHYDKIQAGRVQYISWEEQTEQQRVATTKDTLGQISGLTRSGSSELFEIGKAAAVTNATISGYEAVQKALASLPPPFNFAAAALVGTAAAANVAGIANQQRPKFANGGIVSGNSFTGDRVGAQVNSGEMILNRSQQGKLFNQINSGSSNEETNSLLAQLINVISNQSQSIMIDGREIVSVVREQISSGRSLA
jgi:hypothetical protein